MADSDLLHHHPNEAALPDFSPPESWLNWWSDPPDWKTLVPNASDDNHRKPIHIDNCPDQSSFGMSPKKHHEITRMTGYIKDLVSTRLPHIEQRLRIVDVGSGQGYLTRALHQELKNAPTLALDSSSHQTHGSFVRSLALSSPGSGESATAITHRTIHITPETLAEAIDSWIPSTSVAPPSTSDPAPVLLVALHACGSLTPAVFRSVFALWDSPDKHFWYPAAVVAVGCCYNLMSPPEDFPLSSSPSIQGPFPLPLPTSAFHLAAQVPSHWFDTPQSLEAASLAVRKVVWRALLGRLYATRHNSSADYVSDTPSTGSTPAMRRLGRLPDSAYTTWPTFLTFASKKIGVDFTSYLHNDINPEEFKLLQRRIENLHVRRCLVGPVVENWIINDRVEWIKEKLRSQRGYTSGKTDSEEYTIATVNLFDQATGSARNVALVLAPRPIAMRNGSNGDSTCK